MVQRSVPALVKPEQTSFAQPYMYWYQHYSRLTEQKLLQQRKIVRQAMTRQGRGYTVQLKARYFAVVDALNDRKNRASAHGGT